MVNIVNLVGLGAVVIVGILIFTQFQKLGGFLGALKFPEIKLPELNLNLGGFAGPPQESLVEKGLIDPIIDPESGESRLSEDTPMGGIGLAGAFGDRLRDFFNRPSGETAPPFRDAAIFAKDFPEDFIEAGPSNILNRSGLIEDQKTETEIQSPFGGQQFFGGGPSFQGGQILETPIANLSLSQIIDRFGVTASQASDIRARASGDFGDFDFGTNTGGGIGSIFPTISSLLPNLGAVSDDQFAGLSASEIALRLTGGNISNF